MIKRASLNRATLFALLALATTFVAMPAGAQKVKEGKNDLDALAFGLPELRVNQQTEESGQLRKALGIEGAGLPVLMDFDAFRAREGGQWLMQVDRFAGHAALVEGSGIPWIPGSGNNLSWEQLGLSLPAASGRDVPVGFLADRALAMVRAYPDLFGAAPGDLQLVPASSGPMLDHLYFLHFNWSHNGIPVENAYVVFRLNSGNLVQFGSDGINPAAIRSLVTTPAFDAGSAWRILYALIGEPGKGDKIIESGRLSILPVVTAEALQGSPVFPGTGLAYRLVYTLSFRRPGLVGTWEARIDARTGELLSFLDANRYGTIKGGVYKTDQPATETSVPFPFADYSGTAWADQAGNFSGTTGTSTMTGRTGSAGNVGGVDIVDTCGAISLAANASGVIDFGVSAATDCSTPGGGAGNTRAARTQYYNVTMIKLKAYTYLPGNSWLQGRVTDNVNLNQTCNAYWDGSSLNFFNKGTGSCWNTGELPGVSLHEWAHGMDSNDGSPSGDKGTGETYGDFSGSLQTHGSCAGGGFFISTNCTGYGDACLSCTGIRELDYAKHNQNKPYFPEDLNSNSCTGCSTFACSTSASYAGPCGYEGHCESLVSSQAMWDLPARDLVTWGMDVTSAWQLMDKLWYATRATSGSAYACPTVTTANGCGTSNYFTTFRVVDDCDGNLANGTPHASAIFAAFNRHKIGCTTVVNTDNNCGCATLATPVLAGTPGNNSDDLSWGAVTGASSYDVYRNDAGCSAGFTKIGNTAALTFTDSLAVNGVTYYYRIQANGTGSCPASPMSNCVTLTPVPCVTPGAPTIGTVSVPGNNQLSVSWSAGSPAGATYRIYRSLGACPGGTYSQIATGVSSSPYVDNTVSGTVTYSYKVAAADSTGGCESAQSGCASATATGTCNMGPVFGGVSSVTNAANATCTLTVSWSAATPYCGGPATYSVYRSTTTPFTPGAGNLVASGLSGTSFSDFAGLTSGTTYYYIVRSTDSANSAQETNTVTRSGAPTGPITTSSWTDTFEGSLSGGGFDQAGWTHSAVSGTTNWTWSTAQKNDGTHSWFAQDIATVSDMVLVSPAFGVGSTTTVSFFHTYAFESTTTCYDGGTLEYSSDGGTTWTVVPDADFASGGFNGTVGTSYSNPIGGKRAWCGGTVGTMTQVTVNLGGDATLLGKNIQLRWHEGNDSSTVGTGWYVDTVVVSNAQVAGSCTTGSACTPPGVPTLTGATGDCNGVNLTWTAGSGTTNAYNVYRGTSAGGPYTKLTGMPVTGTSHADTSAVGGAPYYYVVRGACDVGGSAESNVSNERSATRSPLPASPSAPSVDDVSACAQSGVTIGWGTVSGATSYDVQVDGTTTLTGVTSPYAYNPGNSTSHTYTVRANNGCGPGAFSTGTAKADANIVLATPAAPGVADASVCNATGVTITWGTVSGATGYDLLVDAATTVTGVTSPYPHVPGNASSHTYAVRGTAGSCLGSYSSTTSGTDVALAPPSVGTLQMDIQGTKLRLSWVEFADPSVADYYEVMRGLAPSGPFDTSVGTATGTIHGLRIDLATEPGTAYYKVRAVKNGCAGPMS